MATEKEARSAGYPLMRYGLAEYNSIIGYSPNTKNAKNKPETYRFIASTIKGCYISWSRSIPSGEVKIGDDVYLSVPNGWDERLQYYPWYTGHRYWQYNQWDYPAQNYNNASVTPKGARNNESVYRYYHGNETNLDVYVNKNRFTDKLLVWYKKAEPKVQYSQELNPVIENPSPPTDKRTHIRMKIFVRDANTIVRFGLKYYSLSSMVYTYVFGEGSSQTYNQDSVEFARGNYITHLYVSPGYYTVDVNLESYSNDSTIEIVNSLKFVSDASGNAGDSVSLKSLYIDSYIKLSSDSFVLQDNNNIDIDYIYLSVPNNKLSIRIQNHIDDIYFKLNREDQAGGKVELVIDSFANVDNIHLGSTINTIGVDNNVNNIDNIYAYSLAPVKVIDYRVFDYGNMEYDYSSVTTVLNVRSSVVTEVQDMNNNFPVAIF